MKKNNFKKQLRDGGFKLLPNEQYYYINKQGEVASTYGKKLRILKQNSNNKDNPQKGYLFVMLNDKKPSYIHKLVWETFVGPVPEGYELHHKSGRTFDNSLQNLQCIEKHEHRRISNVGKPKSEQQKRKISESLKKSWEVRRGK